MVWFTKTVEAATTSTMRAQVEGSDCTSLHGELDEGLDLLIVAKLLLSWGKVTQEEMVQLLDQHSRTDLKLEHLAYRNGCCSMEEALKVLKARRRILMFIDGHIASEE